MVFKDCANGYSNLPFTLYTKEVHIITYNTGVIRCHAAYSPPFYRASAIAKNILWNNWSDNYLLTPYNGPKLTYPLRRGDLAS